MGEILEVARLVFWRFYFSFISGVVVGVRRECADWILFVSGSGVGVLCLGIALIKGLVLWGNQQLRYERFD